LRLGRARFRELLQELGHENPYGAEP
jgi:hypothetical protein